MFGIKPSGQPDISMLAKIKEKIAAGNQNFQPCINSLNMFSGITAFAGVLG
jgi:hypothetical protein